jgi:hypothetical protein
MLAIQGIIVYDTEVYCSKFTHTHCTILVTEQFTHGRHIYFFCVGDTGIPVEDEDIVVATHKSTGTEYAYCTGMRKSGACLEGAMKAIVLLAFAALLQLQSLSSVTACDGHDHSHNHDTHDHASELRTAEQRQLQGSNVNFQECGFQEPSAGQIAQDAVNMKVWTKNRASKSLRAQSQTYTIPTYFHILQPNATAGIVTDARVTQHVSYLNDAFSKSSTQFVFQLMNTTRTINPAWGDSCTDSNVELAFKTLLKVGGKESLNVYICNKMVNAKGTTIAGYSYYPSATSNSFIKDGVVILRGTDDRRLNTLVHETVCVLAAPSKRHTFITTYHSTIF